MKNIIFILLYSFPIFSTCPYPRDGYTIGGFKGPLSFTTEGEIGFLGDSKYLKIYNMRYSEDPAILSTTELDGYIDFIYAKDNFAYCSVRGKGIYIIDVSNPKNPKKISTLSFGYKDYNRIVIKNNIAYVCADKRYVVDLSDKQNPKVLREFSGSCTTSFIQDNYLYFNLDIYSIEDPKNPVFLSSPNDFTGFDMYVEGNFAFFASGTTILRIYDISDKKNPKKIAELGKYNDPHLPYNLFSRLEYKNDVVYIAGPISSIYLIDVYDKENPFIFSNITTDSYNDIHIYSDFLYGCSYEKTLRVFNIYECKHEYSYPQASFEYEPLNPKAGEKVYFKDTSYPYATSFLWDFGDGQKSTLKNPENVFLKEGEYEIKFTAKNPAGETTITKKIYVLKGQDAPPFDSSGEYKYLIPAVAHKQGANGTFWQSDIEITNDPYGDDANVNIYFIEQGEGNCNFQGFNVLLKSGAQIRLKDVVYKIFQEEKAGALWITSDIPVFISSRTYNTGGGEGTYGQYVPAVEKEKMYKNNKEVVLPNVVWNEEFRTNIGFVNIEDKEIHFCFNYETGEGPLCMTMPPCSWNQLSLSDLIDVNYGYGYMEGFLWTMGYTDGLFIYSSVIDNKTGDAIFVPEIVKP